MAIAIMGFVFPHTLQSMLEESFTDKVIHTYRDDVDLQNLIDFAQQEVNNYKRLVFLFNVITNRPNLIIVLMMIKRNSLIKRSFGCLMLNFVLHRKFS